VRDEEEEEEEDDDDDDDDDVRENEKEELGTGLAEIEEQASKKVREKFGEG